MILRLSLLCALLCAPLPALAEGLIQQVADLRCFSAKAERAAFLQLDGYDASYPVTALDVPWPWEEVALEGAGLDEVKGNAPPVTVKTPRAYRFIRIRIRIGDGFKQDYSDGRPDWTNTGWNPNLQMFRLEDRWMMLSDGMGGPARFKLSLSQFPKELDFYPRAALTALEARSRDGNSCIEAVDSAALPCLREFILRLPAGRKLTAISDVESVTRTGPNNASVNDFRLWGLAAPKLPEGCE